jgi:4-amino-4-deoxy-L-arabinose transferase-like glycosyltransferase
VNVSGGAEMQGRSLWWRRGLFALTGLVGLVGVLCLVGARRQMSGTIDEGNHLAAGLEWWQYGTYTAWTENPPLARVAVAAAPYFSGLRLPPRDVWDPRTGTRSVRFGSTALDFTGVDVLYDGGHYEANLARARFGTFPFFVLTIVAVWFLADGRRKPLAGLLAVALTATVPSLIAHGALATTDVAFVGTFTLAVLALKAWLESPGHRRAIALGVAVALALLTKFSTLVFFPLTALALLGARCVTGTGVRPTLADVPWRWGPLAAQLGLAALSAVLVTWAGYRFSVGRIDALAPELIGSYRILPQAEQGGAVARWLLGLPVPAPELFHGLLFLAAHNAAGHRAYLFGAVSPTGFRSFYWVALAVKTPLPFLVAGLGGLALLLRRARRRETWFALGAAVAAGSIVAVSTQSRVNLGLRHILPVVPLFAVTAARVLAGQLSRSAEVLTEIA